jgi:hypothetical protein
MKHMKNTSLWMLALLLVLTLSVTLLASCDKTPDGPDTPAETTVGGDAPTDGDESSREDPSAPTEPGADTTAPVEPIDTKDATEAPTEEPTEPPVITIPGDEPVSKPADEETEEE